MIGGNYVAKRELFVNLYLFNESKISGRRETTQINKKHSENPYEIEENLIHCEGEPLRSAKGIFVGI